MTEASVAREGALVFQNRDTNFTFGIGIKLPMPPDSIHAKVAILDDTRHVGLFLDSTTGRVMPPSKVYKAADYRTSSNSVISKVVGPYNVFVRFNKAYNNPRAKFTIGFLPVASQ
ncbi:uncharacterized protein BDZ99DRAFT_109513 [Mytilinidion resinicola]|uniref:Uncharacterized protein n=1 Tax=Mytilinidion resinicola TaxID=574789 RepID=A0A6A6YCC5_9PEZI|nr:uncharacterized protein BDZ99DRAFT_109513 [Mytilinidion resinicola]KAF2805674.1 hypothetical protein BDZ99DRAFT_109513 [Mytilinidion resinicola]